ncbi:MAG TPA: SRPBCC family protein [Solirubrobacterales bacterium]|nr:SRPBCC family protein [Solirubrobacterales bacterium]
MATVSKQTEIDAPPDAVWAKLTDTSSYGEWLSTHVGYPDGPPELAEGATFKEKVTVMGMPGEVDWTVTKFEPGSSVEMEGAGPMGTKLNAAYRVEPNGDGTTVTFESGFEGAALAAMAQPLESASNAALEKSLEQLKATLA